MNRLFKRIELYFTSPFFVFSLFLGLQIFVFSRWFYKQETFDYHIDGFAILGAPWNSLWDIFHIFPKMKLDRMGQYFFGHLAWVLFEMNSVAISFMMIWVHVANSTLLMLLVKRLGYKKVAFPIALIYCIHPVTTWEMPYLYLAPDSFGVFFAFCTMVAFFSRNKYSWILVCFFYFWAAHTKETFLVSVPPILFLLHLSKSLKQENEKFFTLLEIFFIENKMKILSISTIAIAIIISYVPIYRNSVNTGAGHEAGGFYSLGYNPFDIFYTIGFHIVNLSLNFHSEKFVAIISKNGFIIIGISSLVIGIVGTLVARAKIFFVSILCFILALGPILLLPIFQSPQSRYSYFASSFLFLSFFTFLNFLYDRINNRINLNKYYFQFGLVLLILGLTYASRHSSGYSYLTKLHSDFSKIRRNQIVDLKARIPNVNQGTHFFIYGLEEDTVRNSLRACAGIQAVYRMPIGCNFDYEAGFKEALKNAKGEYYILKYSKDMNYIEKIEYQNDKIER